MSDRGLESDVLRPSSSVSRRELLRGLGLGTAGLLLAACAGQAPPAKPTEAAKPAAAPATAPGPAAAQPAASAAWSRALV
jgi:peptide/nickel transport system substrate-binding protein